MHMSNVYSTIAVAICLAQGSSLAAGEIITHHGPMFRRQFYGGIGGSIGGGISPMMGANSGYANPFAAFWSQGIVPGQGFPQIGMSAYGYTLPGYGMSPYINPDANILNGVGKGQIKENDLNKIENKINGYDSFKAAASGKGPDPAYPGRFSNESNDDDDVKPAHKKHSHNDDESNGSGCSQASGVLSLAAIAVSALVLQF
ncbi:hypothetical protein BX661DRAFT_173393 [Kickxella alabastrina]|uniref:uncharacterized protein n=1 Tax=Kickxella alabastrina TaxID=61397 RepID=UPI00221F1792|nr:uncharacterized protein BX661DRAFT_173393 [Kickxella alabastrina]KAI7821277.1 hypothetical protein BX661DRAFT_173393 [Kickxella alabastrina]